MIIVENDDYIPSEKVTLYPYNIFVKGKEYEIVATLSHRFMVQKIHVNGKYDEIDDGGIEQMIDVSARLSLLITSDNKHVIEIEDDVFFPYKEFWVVDVPGYIYDKYATALSLLRRLGYVDIFNETRESEKILIDMVKSRKTKMNDWWNLRKNGVQNV